jgi:hypothetical protein
VGYEEAGAIMDRHHAIDTSRSRFEEMPEDTPEEATTMTDDLEDQWEPVNLDVAPKHIRSVRVRKMCELMWGQCRDLSQKDPTGTALNSERQVARLFAIVSALLDGEVQAASNLAVLERLEAIVGKLDKLTSPAARSGLKGRVKKK